MFQANALVNCLSGVIGFWQPDDPSYPAIDTDLTKSSSGLFLQDAHALVTIENLYNVAPLFDSFNYPIFDAAKYYPAGKRVTSGQMIYEALKAMLPNTSVSPSAEPLNWKQIDPFSEWIRRQYQSACKNLGAAIVRQKKLKTSVKSILESQRLYDGFGTLVDRIVKRGRFVGFEIRTKSAEGLVAAINQFAIQSDSAQAGLPLYLYNSSRDEPVHVFEYVATKPNNFIWQDVTDLDLSYMAGGVDSGSTWYFGYYEDELQGQAINRSDDLSQPPCSTCNAYNIQAYARWSKYIAIRAFSVDPAYLESDKTIFSPAAVEYATKTNWGMNLAVNVGCDITRMICANKYVLAQALRMQLVLEFLNQIAFTTRIGVIAETTIRTARAELSEKPGTGSFKLMYLQEVADAEIDLSGLNSTCFPCSTAGKIKVGAI